jgi:hypothetical protein
MARTMSRRHVLTGLGMVGLGSVARSAMAQDPVTPPSSCPAVEIQRQAWQMKSFARGVVLVCGLVVSCSRYAYATPIVVVTGPNDVGTVGWTSTTEGFAIGVGFSTSATYTNVDIAVSLFTFSASSVPSAFQVYLTTQVGPGTTVANEIASSAPALSVPTSDVFAPFDINPYTVLSIPTLSPGSYYLTLRDTVDGDINVVSSPAALASIVTASGVFLTAPELFGGYSAEAYLPASTFDPPGGSPQDLWFSITGTPQDSDVSPIPEPVSLVLVGTGLADLGIRRFRRRRSAA